MKGEGLPSGVDVYDYFDFDKRETVPIDYRPIPRFVPKTLNGVNSVYRASIRRHPVLVKPLLYAQADLLATFIQGFHRRRKASLEKGSVII
ncbi:MAG: hypothetical protein QXU47_09010 [Candidatus Bathyarchaeia archaeon]